MIQVLNDIQKKATCQVCGSIVTWVKEDQTIRFGGKPIVHCPNCNSIIEAKWDEVKTETINDTVPLPEPRI